MCVCVMYVHIEDTEHKKHWFKLPNWTILWWVDSYWLEAIEYHSQTGNWQFIFLKIKKKSKLAEVTDMQAYIRFQTRIISKCMYTRSKDRDEV